MKEQANKAIKIGIVEIEMILVPGGDFWLADVPVTDALWDTVMKDVKTPSKSLYPKVNVSVSDANRFVKRLNEMNILSNPSLSFRLPTEAEWEYAARGGRQSRHYRYSGSNNIDDVAWYWSNSEPKPLAGSHFYIGGPEVHVVKEKRPNELGLYDMSGNVWEWCSDGATGKKHVCRGGCFESEKDECTVDSRELVDSKGNDKIGFRLLLAYR